MQKIIIVEDDQFLREELENIYHKAGYEVCCVTDFPETGAVCEAEHPDLLVLDLGLPGISGFALCKEIRKKGSLPILVLTSADGIGKSGRTGKYLFYEVCCVVEKRNFRASGRH